MALVWTILLVVIFTFLLKALISQSYNWLFMMFGRPWLWIAFMGLLSFIFFWSGSGFPDPTTVLLWSWILSGLSMLPPRSKMFSPEEVREIADKAYAEAGINAGRLKYRLGLWAYFIGGLVGYLVFYSAATLVQTTWY